MKMEKIVTQSSNTAASFPKKNNVLQFPKADGFLGNTPEEIQQTLAKNVSIWIENLLPAVCSSTFGEISKHGINLFDPALTYDMLMVQEACRSLMMSSLKLEHPFQDIARQTLDMDEWGGISIYAYAEDEDIGCGNPECPDCGDGPEPDPAV